MKKIMLLMCFVAVSAMCGCSLFDSDSSDIQTTTGAVTRRKVVTTTVSTKAQDVDSGDEDYDGYTTTTKANADVNEEDFNRVSVSKVTTTTEPPITTTTTTTLSKSVFETLKKPKSDEYLATIESYTVIEDADSLDLRYGPGEDYKSQCKVKEKAAVECLGKSGDWYYINYDGVNGWIEKDSLKLSE